MLCYKNYRAPLGFELASMIALATILSGCGGKTASKEAAHAAPAKVEMVPHETELATVTLTKEAAERLGITTSTVERRAVNRHRTFAGEATIPSGKSIVVSAPVAGVVTAAAQAMFPSPGMRVRLAQPLLLVIPLLSPERDVPTPAEQVQLSAARANLVAAIVTAQGDVDRSSAELKGAKITLDRAQQLLADRAGSRRAVDDAQVLVNIAQSVLAAAQQRKRELSELLATLSGGKSGAPVTPLTMAAPVDGLVRTVSVSNGQAVTGGVALFEVINCDKIWIRVPVYVDLLAQLVTDQPVRIVSLDGSPPEHGGSAQSDPILASPVAAPPTADPGSSSADLYFELANQNLSLRPGQRVGVDLPTKGVTDTLIVPRGAVLYDIYGGTWVYTVSGEHRFVRARVALEWIDGDAAVLSAGPEAGARVVVDGAAELFGTEFGAGK